MKIIQILSLVGITVALTATASAFPYLASSRNAATWPTGTTSTIGVYVHGHGVGQQKNAVPEKETGPVAGHVNHSPHWR